MPTTRGAGQSDPADTESFSYDFDGNVLTFTRRDGSVIATCWDALNRQTLRLVSTTSCTTTSGGASDVFYGYDLAGRITSATYASAAGQGVAYGYDTAGRLTSEASYGQSIGYQYDAAGNRTRVTWPDGFYVVYGYDALNRMTTVGEYGASSGPGLLASYGYDPLSRRTSAALGDGGSVGWGYDAGDRLTSLAHVMPAGGTGFNQSFGYGYTPASQLLSRSETNSAYDWPGPTSGTLNNTYDGLNRDAALAALPDGYDHRDDVTHDLIRTSSYDALNRLTGTALGATSLALGYDPLDRLRQSSSSGGTTTQFLYAGDQLIGEYDGSGNVLRRYVYGAGLDEPAVWYEGAGTSDRRWLRADERGSIIAWSNASGGVTPYSYGPYGDASSWTGSRFRYGGQIMLPEAQLYHARAWAYDPSTGRFLQTDPIGYAGGADLYAYADEDPVDRIDPGGRSSGLGGWVSGGGGGAWNSSAWDTSGRGCQRQLRRRR